MLGKYDEFGEYLDSDTSKKVLKSFFERILCLKIPVQLNLTNDTNFLLLLHYKNKNCIFTVLLSKLSKFIYI